MKDFTSCGRSYKISMLSISREKKNSHIFNPKWVTYEMLKSTAFETLITLNILLVWLGSLRIFYFQYLEYTTSTNVLKVS